MKKVMFVATVVKRHIAAFHLPYLEWFKNNGYEVHVCAQNDYENADDCIIPHCDVFHELPFERNPFRTGNFQAYKAIKRLVDTTHFDIIHCHTPVGGTITRLASRSARKHGTKLIYTAHGFHFYKGARLLNWILFYSIERWLSRYTDLLITINQEDYLRALRFKAKKVSFTNGVGVNLDAINGITIDRNEKRKALNIPHDAFCILSVGELSTNKNHRIIIEAMSRIESKQFHYIVCGAGPLESTLLELSSEMGVSDRIHLLGYRNDVIEIVKASDVFVLPSIREGLSVALMEAMAEGLPVVVSGCRGNVDLVNHGHNGFVVRNNNSHEYAQAIMRIQKSSEVQSKFMKNSKSKIQCYSLNNVMEEMSKLYSEVRGS